MRKQPALAGLRDAVKKRTRRAQFLAEMATLLPRGRLLAPIMPQDPKAGTTGGRPPIPPETMPRVCVLAEPACPRRPDERRTPLRRRGDAPTCRERAGRRAAMPLPAGAARAGLGDLRRANAQLADRGITLRPGGLVGATLVEARPSSGPRAGAGPWRCPPRRRATPATSEGAGRPGNSSVSFRGPRRCRCPVAPDGWTGSVRISASAAGQRQRPQADPAAPSWCRWRPRAGWRGRGTSRSRLRSIRGPRRRWSCAARHGGPGCGS